MTNLRLHPTKGINPHTATCVRCGKPSNAIALLGNNNTVYKCRSCGIKSIGNTPPKTCPKCGSHGSFYADHELTERESVPMGLCTDCEKADADVEKAVREGGIYWRCTSCGSNGAFKAGSGIAEEVREARGIKAPNPIGIEFDETHKCPVCSGSYKEEDSDASDNSGKSDD